MSTRRATPSPDAIEAFLTDLEALYRQHGLRLASGEPIGIAPIEGGGDACSSVRVVARFKDPEDGPFYEYGREVYDDVPTATVLIDELRAYALNRPRAYIDY